jgi:hypothetical protein
VQCRGLVVVVQEVVPHAECVQGQSEAGFVVDHIELSVAVSKAAMCRSRGVIQLRVPRLGSARRGGSWLVDRKRGSRSTIFSIKSSSIFWVISSEFLCIAATNSSIIVSKTALLFREYSSEMWRRSQMSNAVYTKSLFDFWVRCASQNLSWSPMR